MMHGFGWLMFNRFCQGGFNGGFFGIWMYLIVAGLAVIAVVLIVNKSLKKTSDENAIEVLKMQYVEGKITEEEYMKKKKVIQGK